MGPREDNEQLRTFTGMALDRAVHERKQAARIRALRRDPAARLVAATADGVLVDGGERSALHRRPLDGALPDARPILLGLERGAAVFALDLEPGAGAGTDLTPPNEAKLISLREAALALPQAESGLAAYLVGLLNWHRSHRYCARCGAPTTVTEAGYSRTCSACGTLHFPRTDPVVIMTVEHQGRLLMGRRAGWPAGRMSVLAGFVSPGETLEEAVVREVREESGIVARDPTFVTSQPWPFPASLMLGFHALADGGEPRPHDGELEEVHWLTPDEVRAAATERRKDIKLPPPISIARFLIDRWLAARER
jgi:NAD+ diphosphatase